MLDNMQSESKAIAGYGTSIGATTFIYQLGMGERLGFLVDDDPYRQNLVSPGYHIPVVSGEALSDQNPDFVAILAPLYGDRIRNRNSAYSDRGGRFLDVWPNIKLY